MDNKQKIKNSLGQKLSQSPSSHFRLAYSSASIVRERQRKYADQRTKKQSQELEMCTF